MDRQQILTIGSIGVMVIVAMLWLKPFGGDGEHGDNNANLPDGAWYLCSDAACGHEFNLTVKELNAHYEANYGKPNTQPPCPKCHKTLSQRAGKCDDCGKVAARSSSSTQCPHCKAEYKNP